MQVIVNIGFQRNLIHWALLDLNQNSQPSLKQKLTKSTPTSALQKALHLDQVPSELKELINNWTRLPEAVRAAIVLLSQQGVQKK